MAGSSTAELRLRPTREDDLDYVVAAEADPDNAPFLAPSPEAPGSCAPRGTYREADARRSRCCGSTRGPRRVRRLVTEGRWGARRRAAGGVRGRAHRPTQPRTSAAQESAPSRRMDRRPRETPPSTTTSARPTRTSRPSASSACSAPCRSSCRCGSAAPARFRCAEEEAIYRADIERRAAAYGLMPLRWPPRVPGRHRVGDARRDVREADRPGGRVLDGRVPPGVRRRPRPRRARLGAGRGGGRGDAPRGGDQVGRAARHARGGWRRRRRRRGRRACATCPAVRVGDAVFHGDRELEAAARALAPA